LGIAGVTQRKPVDAFSSMSSQLLLKSHPVTDPTSLLL
jgi:hypothetical protein